MSERILERLIALTQQGQLNWRFAHRDPDILTGVGSLVESASPVAFMAEDNDLGRLLLVLSDPANESFDPYLILNGERLEASGADLGLLRDHVKIYMQELFLGQMRSPEQVIDEHVEAVYDAAGRQQQAQMQLANRLMTQVERSQELIGQALVVATAASSPSAAPQAACASVPLTTESLQAALALIEKHAGISIEVHEDILEEIVEAIEDFFSDPQHALTHA